MKLDGKHLLITRPEPENTLSCSFFEAAGAEVTSLPVMEIAPLEEKHSSIQSQLFELDNYNKVIFISKNAVRHGVEWIDHCWPQLPVGIEWIGIGDGTTQLLNELGYPLGIQAKSIQLAAENGDVSVSEALVQSPSFQQVENEKILIVKGSGGRELLADTLKQRGANVNSLALYKRAKITYSLERLEKADSADIICITSAEGLENLVEMLSNRNKNWFNKTLITPSQRVADKAKSLGWNNVINAHGADDNRLMTAIIQL